MDTKKLRQKILDLAIRGKLVPQDPNDEPASVLLERIRAEKEALIKEGKIKRAKKTTASDTSHYENVPFELPKGWCWRMLGDIGTWQSGGTPSRMHKEYYGGNIPWLKTGDLNDGIITSIPECITEEGLNNSSAKLNPAGSVLIAMYGATIGKVGILDIPATTNQACCACIDYQGVIQKYLFYFLMSHKDEFVSLGGGGAQPNISKDIIVKTFIPIPPISEQERIVNSIEQLNAQVDSLDNNEDSLRNIIQNTKTKVLDLAIHGRLVAQDPNDEPAYELLQRINPNAVTSRDNPQYQKPYDIPEGWTWCKLLDICSFLSRGKSPVYSETDRTYPVFAQKCNLKEGGISLEKAQFLDPTTLKRWPEEYKLKNGDILVNSTGTGTVGRTRLFDSSYLGDYPFVVPDSHVSVIRTYDDIDSGFIFSIMSSPWIQSYLEDNLAGSTNQKELYISVLQNIDIPLPPINEQSKIALKVSELFKGLEKIQTELEA